MCHLKQRENGVIMLLLSKNFITIVWINLKMSYGLKLRVCAAAVTIM